MMKKTYLLFLAITVIIFNSCSSSANEEQLENFLQKFDGTVWVFENNEAKTYYVIQNNENNPITKYVKLKTSNCYYISDEIGVLEPQFDSITILEENKFQIKSNYGANENYIFTFTVSQDNINFNKIENYFGSTTNWDYVLTKTNLLKNQIEPICP